MPFYRRGDCLGFWVRWPLRNEGRAEAAVFWEVGSVSHCSWCVL